MYNFYSACFSKCFNKIYLFGYSMLTALLKHGIYYTPKQIAFFIQRRDFPKFFLKILNKLQQSSIHVCSETLKSSIEIFLKYFSIAFTPNYAKIVGVLKRIFICYGHAVSPDLLLAYSCYEVLGSLYLTTICKHYIIHKRTVKKFAQRLGGGPCPMGQKSPSDKAHRTRKAEEPLSPRVATTARTRL